MTDGHWLPPLLRRLKRHPLLPHGTGTAVTLGGAALGRLLPHRPPMLLIDGIDGVDVATQAVRGHRHLQPGDLGFAGHFPDQPIYPGLLLVEAMGQLGLTLVHFCARRSVVVDDTVAPPPVRATHVHYAAFLAPVVPGDRIELHAQLVDHSYTAIAAGQVWKDGALAAYAVSEVFVGERDE